MKFKFIYNFLEQSDSVQPMIIVFINLPKNQWKKKTKLNQGQLKKTWVLLVLWEVLKVCLVSQPLVRVVFSNFCKLGEKLKMAERF